MDRGAWWAAVHRVAQSQILLKQLSMHACIGEGNGNPSSILAWRISGTEEPGGLPSMGSHSQTRLKQLSSSNNILSFAVQKHLSFFIAIILGSGS